jgi:outer membrane protein assembly factor BamE (lipoprotein component of BamABCDE complex)
MLKLNLKIMKKLLVLSIISMMILTTSCITTRSTTKINKVEVGMTKNEITELLGSPLFKNGDIKGEQWGYRKHIGEITDPEEVIFLVTFDENGEVASYDTIKEHGHRHF